MSTHLTEAIVRIREMILRGDLAPGQRVAEAPLAASKLARVLGLTLACGSVSGGKLLRF